MTFDARLQELYLSGLEEDPAVMKWLETALIVFSGYRGGEYAPFAAAVEKMKEQEIASGRWDGFSGDESAAAGLVATRAHEDTAAGGADESDAFGVTLTVGLYTYVIVLRSYQGDPGAFRRVFVGAWAEYWKKMRSATVS